MSRAMMIMSSGNDAGSMAARPESRSSAVGEILQVAQPLADIGIGRLAEPCTHIVETTLHARLGGEARPDRFADALEPAAIVDEHAEGFQDLALLARLHVVRLEHAVDILAHAMCGFLEALQLLADILGDHLLDRDARLVQHGVPIATPGVSCTPSTRNGSRPRPSTCCTSLGLTK